MKQYLIKFLYKIFKNDGLFPKYVDKEQILLIRANSYEAARSLILDSAVFRIKYQNANSFENLTIE